MFALTLEYVIAVYGSLSARISPFYDMYYARAYILFGTATEVCTTANLTL